MRKKKDLEKLDDTSTDIFYPNLSDNYYPNRPDTMESFVLYYLASNYNFQTKMCQKKKSQTPVVKH